MNMVALLPTASDLPLLGTCMATATPLRLVLTVRHGAYDQGTGYRDNVVVTSTPLSES